MISSMERDTRRGRPFLRHLRRLAQARRLARVSLSLIAVFSASALIGACSPDRIAGPTANLTAGTVSLASEVFNATENGIPWDSMEENTCNGETVPVHGKLSTATIVSGDLVTHIRWQFHSTVDGVGSMSHVYHGADEFEQEENSSIYPFEMTIDRNVTMTSQTAPDMHLHWIFHITVKGPTPTDIAAFVEKGNPIVGDCTK